MEDTNTRAMVTNGTNTSIRHPASDVMLGPLLIKMLFHNGVSSHEWLRSWRYAHPPKNHSLEELITSLRNEKPPAHWRQATVAGGAPATEDPNAKCTLCTYSYLNRRCYAKHPELAPKDWKKKKDKSRKAAKAEKGSKAGGAVKAEKPDSESSDSDSDSD